jgi:AbiV family abortive infection protein
MPEQGGATPIDVIAERLYQDARVFRASLPRDAVGNPASIQNPTDNQLSLSCLLNSVALVHSADQLAREGEHGPARSLLILGIEELSKSVVYRWFDFGLFSSNPADRGERPYLERAILTCHQCKQLIIHIARFSQDFLTEIWDKAALDGALETIRRNPDARAELPVPTSSEELNKRIEGALRANPGKTRAAGEMLVEATTLEGLKWSGFYVELGESKLRAPWLVTPNSFDAMRARYFLLLDSVFNLVQPSCPPETEKLLRRFAEPFGRMPSEPFECEHGSGIQYRKKVSIKQWKVRPTEDLTFGHGGHARG